MDYLEFIETTVFSRKRAELVKDDDFQAFQSYLLLNHHEGGYDQPHGRMQKDTLGAGRKGKTRRRKSDLLSDGAQRPSLFIVDIP